jgi:hypothetical protein
MHQPFESRQLVPLAGGDFRGERRPRPSVTRCNLLPNPPRERPNAWSAGSWTPLSCRPRRPRVRPGPRAVHAPQVPIDLALGIQTNLQPFQNPVEPPFAPPPLEAVVHRLPRAEAFRQVPPRDAGPQDPQRSAEHQAVVLPLATPLPVGRKQVFDQRPCESLSSCRRIRMASPGLLRPLASLSLRIGQLRIRQTEPRSAPVRAIEGTSLTPGP